MANEHNNQGKTGGNFANDPQRASEAGKKGAQQSHQGSGQHSKQPQEHSGDSSQRQHGGGSNNFADNPERASEAGRKGGEASKNR